MIAPKRIPLLLRAIAPVFAGLLGIAFLQTPLVTTSIAQAEQQKTPPAQTQKPAAADRTITDDAIALAIENRFRSETAVPWHLIDVAVANGIVTLSGIVDNVLAKDRATLIAESVRGVRAVVDTITVKPPARSDAEIGKDIVAALAADPATDSREITPAVKDGAVTLTGKVQSFRERLLAEHVAKGVKGVKEVKAKLDVEFEKNTNRPDGEVAAEIQRGLDTDAWIDASGIRVAVQNGRAILTGQVGSAVAKRRAEAKAWVSGITSVDATGLTVEPALRDAMRKPPGRVTRSDVEIQRALKEAFLHDPRVFSFNPRIEVKNGYVTLSGTVENLAAKRAAEHDARNTAGVHGVRNHLKVRPAQSLNDAQIAQAVTAALLRDPFVDKHQIKVSAQNGVVTLRGSVDSSFERSMAEDIASRIRGIVSVNNRLSIAEPGLTSYRLPWASDFYDDAADRNHRAFRNKPDEEIAEDIRDHLWWSPFIDADEVKVSVENGVATLTGKVDSWTEFNAATENAFEGGAHSVRNELKVKDSP